MGQPSGRPTLLISVCLSLRLAVEVLFGLRAFYVFLQVRPVGIIGHACKSALQFFDGFVEFALTAINAGQTNVRYPKVGIFLRI
jgi:hypothetical protein